MTARKQSSGKINDLQARRRAPLTTPTSLNPQTVAEIAGAMNALLADVYTLYFKTKNFHWHISGPHFREYHLLLDDQAAEILNMTDIVAERVRKIGAGTLKSLNQIVQQQRLLENEADFVDPRDMLAELRDDNLTLIQSMRNLHDLVAEKEDVAAASLIEVWIDEAERRVWFLFETGRAA
ncbi:Dps family protein [Micavibrio aeruginosavorus]|nr:DNA starvation/stationary phase protection protein [Micavibrio aeruginosavorus]